MIYNYKNSLSISYLAHTGPIFLNLQLLSLEKIFFSRVGLLMFKCSNNMLPNVISNLYIKNNEIHSISQETVISSEFRKVLQISQPLVQEYGMKLSLKL